MSRKLGVTLFLAALVLGATVHGVRGEDDEEDDGATPATLEALAKQKEALYAKKAYDETGYERLPAPKKGEWLARFKETGQDEAAYRTECKNKRRTGREKVYVTELGDLSERCKSVQGPVRDFLHAFFQLEVVRRDPRAMPAGTFVKKRKQYDGDALLENMKDKLPDDALASVGLLDKDIFTEGLNFIFGQGSLADRVGIYSFVRLQDGEETKEPLYRERCFRLVAHEVGHIMGMEHCVYYRCVMNGANSLDEDDTAPLHLCPVCQAKLRWNIGFDDLAREKDLAAICAKNQIDDEAKWSQARVARLEKK
jgi:archaemetzincin